MRILLAEDDNLHQHLLLLSLVRDRPQVDVTVVSTAEALLEALQRAERPYDCIVIDFHLNGSSADDLFRACSDAFSHCPSLVISSDRSARARVSGPDRAFMEKAEAVTAGRLWRRIEVLVTRFRERRPGPRVGRHQAPMRLVGEHFGDRPANEPVRPNRPRRQVTATIQFAHATPLVGDALLDVVRDYAPGRALVTPLQGGGLEIVQPGGTGLDLWLWAEGFVRRTLPAITRGDERLRETSLCIGVIDGHSAAARRHGEAACRLARAIGAGAVCTRRMVVATQAAAYAARLAASPVERRRLLLRCLHPILGEHQRQHTGTHCAAVAQLATQLARAMDLSPTLIDAVHLASLLHDIGKAVIPESLLGKPRTLTMEEWEVMAQHEYFSGWIADRLGVDPLAACVIREHHHRFDDHVEPMSGDTGADDPRVGAQVVCVADALVTMRTTRSYRQARPLADALAELDRERGRQFHPAVVDATHYLACRARLAA